MRTASRPSTRPREGRALVELLVAGALLVIAGAGAARALVTAERATRRAREVAAAEALVAARLDAWSVGACASSAGERVVGTQREWWRVVAHDGLATLVDSVAPVDEGSGPRAGIVGMAPCAP